MRGQGSSVTPPVEDISDTVMILEEEDDDEDFGDPCHEFEHSVFFFLILTVALIATVIYFFLLAKRRIVLLGYDILYVLLLVLAMIRFGPKVWGALQVHGVHHASQTGCKLVAFTEFGLRHVNTALVVGLVLYAWFAARKQRDDVDQKIRDYFPWLLLFLLGVEGVTGMVPAIYTDVDFSGLRCDFARSQSLTVGEFLAAQILLSTLMPYILPFLLLIYPLVMLVKTLLDLEEEEPVRSVTRNILIVVLSHIALSLPWALHAMVMLPLLQGWTVGMDAVTVCVVDGVFRLLLETWYVIVPIVAVLGDPVLGKDLPGVDALKSLCQMCARRITR